MISQIRVLMPQRLVNFLEQFLVGEQNTSLEHQFCQNLGIKLLDDDKAVLGKQGNIRLSGPD